MKRKIFFPVVLIMLISMIGESSAYAQAAPQNGSTTEEPKEFTMEEYLADVDQFYESHPEFIITMDLADPQGIDHSLLPEDLRAAIPPGLRVVAFRETIRKGGKAGKLCPSPKLMNGISCATNSASRDMTTSQIFGSVEEFARTVALRYDWYPRCQGGVNCFGWEVEKQYMWWKRTDSAWNVKNGKMLTYIEAENYCTQDPATLNYGSSTVSQPTWSGNQTYVYSISGFPNTAYVPWPSGYSYTQGDIYQGTTLKYDDQRVYQYWPRY